MQSCVSCLTWLVAIPVLLFAAFALGPWFWVLVAFVVLLGWLAMRADKTAPHRCPRCGQRPPPAAGQCCGRCRGNGC